MRTATKVFAMAAVLGAIGGSVFLSSRSATANGFAGPFAGGTHGSGGVSADDDITPYSVVAQAASGERAFGVAHDGARIYFGESGNVYCYNNAGEVQCASAWKIQSLSVDTIGSFTANRYTDVFRVRFFPTSSLGTCNGTASAGNNPEGAFVVLSGASLSGQSRACLCVSDGAGTPAYSWRNMGCPTEAGDSTTCPACP